MKKATAKITGPTYLTIARMILAVLFFAFVLVPETWAKAVALALFVAGAISDEIDGKWARKHKIVTDLGAFLDPLADKMLVNLAFLALTTMNVVPVWMFAVILVRDFAVDGMRMMVARTGTTVSASFYGKLKTTMQMIALVVLIANLIINVDFIAWIGNIVLYMALILTIFSGVKYLVEGYQKTIK